MKNYLVSGLYSWYFYDFSWLYSYDISMVFFCRNEVGIKFCANITYVDFRFSDDKPTDMDTTLQTLH